MFQSWLELTTKNLIVIFTFSIAQNVLSVEVYYIDYVSIAGYQFCLNPLTVNIYLNWMRGFNFVSLIMSHIAVKIAAPTYLTITINLYIQFCPLVNKILQSSLWKTTHLWFILIFIYFARKHQLGEIKGGKDSFN